MLGVSFMFIQLITMLSQIYIVMQSHFKIKKLLKLDIWEEDATIHIPIIENHAHIPTLGENFRKHIQGDSGQY